MNILLLYGGKSCEHDISVITGCLARGYFPDDNVFCCYFDGSNNAFLAINTLTPAQHKTTVFKTSIMFGCGDGKIYLTRKKRLIKGVKIDCAVNCCHGVNGEDGTVAGILQMANIPSAQSGVVSSGAAMDKILTKLIAKGANIPVLPAISASAATPLAEIVNDVEKQLGYPVIVKPATLGSSIGIGVADGKSKLEQALFAAFCFDGRVLIERALTDFYELNCSAIEVDGKVETSKIEKPLCRHEILTFADKYLTSGEKGFSLKAGNAPQTHFDAVRQLTEKLYKTFDFCGVIRVDYIVDNETDTLYLNEINAVPGSLAYGLWQNAYTKKQFGQLLVRGGVEAFAGKEKLTYRFMSDVLQNLPMKK